MYTEYQGMAVLCGHCFEAKGHSMHVMWANGNGAKIRIFCPNCGHSTDKKRVGNIITVTVSPKPWKWGYPETNPIGWGWKEPPILASK